MLFRSWRIFFLVVLVSLSVVIMGVNYVVEYSTRGQVFSEIDAVPKNKVGILLGTAKYKDKSKNIVNLYYQYRIDAAVALYMAGKVDYIIVSGDNSTDYYNEPRQMKQDLMARGVPGQRIYMDNGGFRTLDSILRCRDVFGQYSFTIISQRFHNQRAVYIANHKNLKTVGFDALDGDSFWDVVIREKLARVKMMLDLLLNKQAQVYGNRIEIG